MEIGGFLPLSLNDFPGHPAAVVFTQGCNFRCGYCHNPSLLECCGGSFDQQEIFDRLQRRQRVLKAVVITGGEPCVQTDLDEFCRQLKSMGLLVKLDTNGSRPATLAKLLREKLLDYVAMDIKANWAKYDLLCGGRVNVRQIKRSVEMISASGVDHHFRTTFDRRLLDDGDIDEIRRQLPTGSKYILQRCRLDYLDTADK